MLYDKLLQKGMRVVQWQAVFLTLQHRRLIFLDFTRAVTYTVTYMSYLFWVAVWQPRRLVSYWCFASLLNYRLMSIVLYKRLGWVCTDTCAVWCVSRDKLHTYSAVCMCRWSNTVWSAGVFSSVRPAVIIDWRHCRWEGRGWMSRHLIITFCGYRW